MPRFALLADIHANLEALEAVLDDLSRVDVDHTLCLGDVVGYGPDPAACVELVYDCCDAVVLGNHDEAVFSDSPLDRFNERAKAAILFARSDLSGLHRRAIADWPLADCVDGLTIAHASLGPDRWEYLYSPEAAKRTFDAFRGPFAAVGHTHIPSAFSLVKQPSLVLAGNGPDAPREVVRGHHLAAEAAIRLPEGPANGAARFIVNPGAVGQPRDGNPDASYAILDTTARTVQIRRVSYDLDATMRKIADAGLPAPLADRLRIGA
ncbi:MAG: metallophosphoesterase family protein [Phycisphaeraceae bacterium]|nr:metallophosphoesterase family protein [Phycisphaeraceae bacterium]